MARRTVFLRGTRRSIASLAPTIVDDRDDLTVDPGDVG